MTDMTESILQEQHQAERMFCVSVFGNPDNARHDCGWLSPALFRDARYAQYWQAVLNGKDQYEAAIEAKIYTEMVNAVPDVSSFAYKGFAEKIIKDTQRTNYSMTLPQVVKAVIDGRMDEAASMLENLVKDKPDMGDTVPSVFDVAFELSELVEQERRSIKTYIKPLDEAIGGFERQTLTILAARPSMGKTALAFQFARSAAKAGHSVLYFSIEMSATSLWARAVCGALEINWRDVLEKNLSKLPGGSLDSFRAECVNLAGQYGEDFRVDDSGRVTLDNIWQRVAKYTPDLLIIDHQGLVAHSESNPVKRAGMVAWGLKQIGKEFNIPVLMLQQLNRGVESRDNKRPVMSDLRESGELEEIADTVLFIYRDDYYLPPEEQPKISDTEIVVAKHRNGARNQGLRVRYHLPRQWFYRNGDLEQGA